MIIFDFNQVAISNLMQQIGSSKNAVEENLVRHMILNTIRTYVHKFKSTHGPEVVIVTGAVRYFHITKHHARKIVMLLVTTGILSLNVSTKSKVN
jgi:hypothetical protein